MERLRILLLEDSPLDAELVLTRLTEDGVASEAVRVETRADYLTELERDRFDLILADYSLPSFDGGSALAIARERCPEVPFIFVSGALAATDGPYRAAGRDSAIDDAGSTLERWIRRIAGRMRKIEDECRPMLIRHRGHAFQRACLRPSAHRPSPAGCPHLVRTASGCGLADCALSTAAASNPA